jgi:hypothetical protein
MYTRMILFAVFTVVVSSEVRAQVGRDVAERGSNRSQISQGKAAMERDTKEQKEFASHLSLLKNACSEANMESANRELADLKRLMDVEVEQAAAKVEAMKRELAASASETGSNRRESRRNRDDSDAFGQSSDDEADAVRDAANRIDDVRDVADDKKDLAAQGERVGSQQKIAQSFSSYQFVLDSPAGLDESKLRIASLEEFATLMSQDIAATKAEMSEDRKEAGEDRRETRDDLQEADEVDNQYRRETEDFGRRGRR